MNRVVKLAERPKGMPGPSTFRVEEEPIPEPDEGEFLVRIEYVSLDPAMRGWIAAGRSYVEPVAIGGVMRAFAAGIVEASLHPDYHAGDAVTGMFGVRQYAISDGSERVLKVDADRAPLPRWIGGLGMPGHTAYFGLTEIGRPKPGETVCVAAAAGAVGSIVGQIAKIYGCRAVGIAGGENKCRHVVDELGFDACVDHKADDFAGALRQATPDGIDIYFENVGMPILDHVLARMNMWGRIPVCGLIAHSNDTEPRPGPTNIRSILVNRLTVRGFLVFDFADRLPEAVDKLGRWHADGRLKMREDVREGGVDAFPQLLGELYTGGNFGKLVLEV